MISEKIRRLLGLARRARGLAVGSRETRQGIRSGDVRLVLLAADGSSRDRERVLRIAGEGNVPAHTLATRVELGAWVGKGPVAVLGIRDPHLAAAVRARLHPGSIAPEEAERVGKENGGQNS